VWSWRYQQDGRKQRFNVHFDPASGRAARFTTTDDAQQVPGA
jgi:hypothetical protein